MPSTRSIRLWSLSTVASASHVSRHHAFWLVRPELTTLRATPF
jgi:hypothetical protein